MRHVAFVEVLQLAPVVEKQIELSRRSIAGLAELEREEASFLVREVEAVQVENRFVRAVWMNGPLERVVVLQSLEASTSIKWRERGHLGHDFRRMRVIPLATQAVGNVLGDLPIGTRIAQLRQRLI